MFVSLVPIFRFGEFVFVCGSLHCPLRLVVVVREGDAERRISFLGVMDWCPDLCFFLWV